MEKPSWLKKTPKRNRPKQQKTHNEPTVDEENSNDTNSGGNSLIANMLWTGSEERKDAASKQGEQEINYSLTNTSSTNAKRDAKTSLWRRLTCKIIRYGHMKMNNRLSKNVPDILRRHKVYIRKPGKTVELNWQQEGKTYMR